MYRTETTIVKGLHRNSTVREIVKRARHHLKIPNNKLNYIDLLSDPITNSCMIQDLQSDDDSCYHIQINSESKQTTVSDLHSSDSDSALNFATQKINRYNNNSYESAISTDENVLHAKLDCPNIADSVLIQSDNQGLENNSLLNSTDNNISTSYIQKPEISVKRFSNNIPLNNSSSSSSLTETNILNSDTKQNIIPNLFTDISGF